MDETRHCESCGRPMLPRRRWRDDYEAVRYCSRACRARRVNRLDRSLERAIESLLTARQAAASICPSEAARLVAAEGNWRGLMEPVRRAARRMAHRGEVEILQRGKVVAPGEFRGPIRIRRCR